MRQVIKPISACRTGPAMAVCLVALAAALATPLLATQQWESDDWLEQPVDDATFRTFLEFFAYDPQVPLDVEVLDASEADGIRDEHLTFVSTPDMRVTARFYQQSGAGAGQPGVIWLHGGGRLGKDGAGTVRYAQALARAGWGVLTIDMLYFGERNTGLLETFREAEKHERLYNRPGLYLDWMIQNVKDVGRSYDFLVQDRGADPTRVVLMGVSRGAPVAMIAGGVDDRFAGVVSLIGGHFDARETGHRAAACPANYIGRISPRPLMMVNAEYDADFDKEKSVLPLQRQAREPTEFHWNDTGHMTPSVESTVPQLVDWLRRVPARK